MASSHMQHPTGHVAIMATVLSLPVNERFGVRGKQHAYVFTYIFPLINTPPPPEGVIISQPIFRFLGVIFDVDHDFEGP